MKQGYAFQGFDREKMARALGKDLPISTKHSTMVCNAIRGRSVEQAMKILADSIRMKKAIPFTRYNRDKGHKTKIGPGRYVVKTCQEIAGVISSAEANGHQKNLGEMFIVHACAQCASRPWHFGRWRRRQMKRSHIEIVVAERSRGKKEANKGKNSSGQEGGQAAAEAIAAKAEKEAKKPAKKEEKEKND